MLGDKGRSRRKTWGGGINMLGYADLVTEAEQRWFALERWTVDVSQHNHLSQFWENCLQFAKDGYVKVTLNEAVMARQRVWVRSNSPKSRQKNSKEIVLVGSES